MIKPTIWNYVYILMGFTGILYITACEHGALSPDDDEPTDTMMMPPDTMMGVSCNPDTVLFERDVLPILQTNCARSGCHDETTATAYVILDTYANVMSTGGIIPFDATNSRVYARIDNPDIPMPPIPNLALTQRQRILVETWINQGALNLSCETPCETATVSFSQDIIPIMQDNCTGCHAIDNNSFGGFPLETYSQIKIIVEDGRLSSSINFEAGVTAMPYLLPKMDSCRIAKIDQWIAEGALNN